jgi:hypothetical protein
MMAAGITPEIMAALSSFFSTQPTNPPRPSGLLQPNQIRGVNPRYQYVYREFPKALTPPDILVRDELMERDLRARWGAPLPWPEGIQPNGMNPVAAYYAGQHYPKTMTPPQVLVNSRDEEESLMASWNIERPAGDSNAEVTYPRWMFHASEPATLISNRDHELALGPGWYPTPNEALNAARKGSTITTEQLDEHSRLVKQAVELGVRGADSRWTDQRLKNAIAGVEAKKQAA